MRLTLAAVVFAAVMGFTRNASAEDLSTHVTSTFKVGKSIDDNERASPYLAIFDVSKAVRSCIGGECPPVVSLFVYNHNFTKEKTINIKCRAMDGSGYTISEATVSPTLAPFEHTITVATFDTMDVDKFKNVICEIVSMTIR